MAKGTIDVSMGGSMVVLYNGEKCEYDVTQQMNWQQVQEGIEYRKVYVGQSYGNFEIVSTDYDWGTRRQVNIARCVNCGEEKKIRNLAAFMRGKGEGGFCKCHYRKEKKTSVPIAEIYKQYVGQVIGNFTLLDYQSGKGFRVECLKCSKRKWVGSKAALENRVVCSHKVANDYSDPSYMAKRVGCLTPVCREGTRVRFRCDCGDEIVRKPGEVFRREGVKSCGKPECLYHRMVILGGNDRRQRGLAFERECAIEMEKQGFPTEMTPGTGDYGVDFFATVDGERVAFQCKRLKAESMVRAIQEVYAGGRYYDCCRFVVVSPSGFTYPSELMAAKLGVQLEKSLRNFSLQPLEENRISTQKVITSGRRKVIWEIDGISKTADEWCKDYGISRSAVIARVNRGMDLKTALTCKKYVGGRKNGTPIEIGGVVKTKHEWCEEYGISPQLYDYRVKWSGLPPLEALSRAKAR